MAKLKRKKGLKDVTGDGKFTYADVLKMRGVKPKKSMGKGGTVEYGLGGAIMAGINAIKNKEGLVGGIKNVAKAYATPGSGIAQGAKLAGGMLSNSNNPLLAGIGKAAGIASNFMPGGGGPKGALGNIAQAGNLAGKLPGGLAGLAGQFGQNAGGSGMAGVMPALQGLFSQEHGGVVGHRLKYAEEGMSVPQGPGEKKPKGEIPGLDVKSTPTMIGFDVEAQKPIMGKATQMYIDGLPVSGREAAAFIKEKSEGMEGQGGVSVPDALMAAQLRRIRERRGRDHLGQGMWRVTAEEELQRDQKAAGTRALLKRLNEYDGGNVRRTRSY